jgi:hypothetical protein
MLMKRIILLIPGVCACLASCHISPAKGGSLEARELTHANAPQLHRSRMVRVLAFYPGDPSTEYCQFVTENATNDTTRFYFLQALLGHFTAGQNLGELADLLGQPKWLKKSFARCAMNNELYYAQAKEFFDPYTSFFVWYPFPPLNNYIEIELRVPDSIRVQRDHLCDERVPWTRGRSVTPGELFEILSGKGNNVLRQVEVVRIK